MDTELMRMMRHLFLHLDWRKEWNNMIYGFMFIGCDDNWLIG